MKNKIKNSILSSLVCDSYSLGSHWVYDENELQSLAIDWDTLNPPQSLWHRGAESGDFTHYGSQALFLLEYVSKNSSFNKETYYEFWKEKMSTFDGYVDGSSRAALENIGAVSNDLSICGRIAPLLLCSSFQEEFMQNVAAFVSITHNSELALNASAFFAELLWLSQENSDVLTLINRLKPKYPRFTNWIDQAIQKRDNDSFTTIREFGPACGIDGGFAGVIYLLLQNQDFKSIMIQNAKAGGDSSARGMVVAMILGLHKDCLLPQEWVEGMNQLPTIRKLLK